MVGHGSKTKRVLAEAGEMVNFQILKMYNKEKYCFCLQVYSTNSADSQSPSEGRMRNSFNLTHQVLTVDYTDVFSSLPIAAIGLRQYFIFLKLIFF